MEHKPSASEDPNRMVKVAVLPPRLPPGMAPPTGLGVADMFSWDESVNYQHNNPIQNGDPNHPRKKSFMQKIGLTGERQRLHSDTPPFSFREVPYHVWRKHYAKDKDGNYKGTHAPAQDCLLLPHDVEKWSAEAPKFEGDKYTRGAVALPVYQDVTEQEHLPAYTGEPVVDADAKSASPPNANQPAGTTQSAKTIADGKTAQQIIEEAKAKAAAQPKSTWSRGFKKGLETMVLGS